MMICDSINNMANKKKEINKNNEIKSIDQQGEDQSIFIKQNQILYGPPGTGKTYNTVIKAMEIIKGNSYDKIKEEYKTEYDEEKHGDFDSYCYKRIKAEFDKSKKEGQIEFITFHQSYAYEEFVEGIKPNLPDEWGKPSEKLNYKGSDGVFKKIVKEAYKNENKDKNKDKKYVLIIDEINRGNISKIFGELITLLEEDKRESFSVRLPYSHEEFTVPKNLYIIGTMNTSDRSIASIDIALRRRFTFKEMMPDSKLVADFGVEFSKKFKELNNRIRILLDRDHQIGHSYFIKDKYENGDIENLKEIWFDCVMPLLNEYFYNDWEKLIALLGEPKYDKDKKLWLSFIKKENETKFATKYDIDETECYDFVSENEMDETAFKEALETAFPNQIEYKEKE
jgi:5-methylcytosine-specific restriction protein B